MRKDTDGHPWMSVITSVLNDSAGLHSTRDSLLEQSEWDWEWIIADGRSTDGTTEQAMEWAEKDPRIRVDCEADSGVYDGMNRGLSDARGRLVHFLNARDTYASRSSLAGLRSFANQLPADWYRCDLRITFPNGRQDQLSRAPWSQKRFMAGGLPVHHQGTVMSRELLLLLGGFRTEYMISADYDLMLRASVLANTTPVDVPLVLCNYEFGGLSVVNWRTGQGDMHHSRLDVLDWTARGRLAESVRVGRRIASISARRWARILVDSLKSREGLRSRNAAKGSL